MQIMSNYNFFLSDNMRRIKPGANITISSTVDKSIINMTIKNNGFELPTATNGNVFRHNGNTWIKEIDFDNTYSAITTAVTWVTTSTFTKNCK